VPDPGLSSPGPGPDPGADPIGAWLAGGDKPDRVTVKAAVKASLALLVERAPGHTVEVRVPPFGAVQCVEGPRHTRGNPPNVVEADPRTWLALSRGILTWCDAVHTGVLTASGSRAPEVATLLPLR